MSSIRVSLATLLIWLAAVFNLERLHEPLNIASFVYVFAGLLAVAVICLRSMRAATIAGLVVGALSSMLGIKLLLGYPTFGPGLPLTITEAMVLVITVGLSHKVARWLRKFEDNAAQVAAIRWQTRPQSFDEGQSAMYKELRRARQFERPLALVTLEPTSNTFDSSLDRILEEVQHEMVQRYFEARLADTLEAELKDCDQLANYNGRFVLLVPEADAEQARTLMHRIARRVEQEMGLTLRMGMATFPDEELTLTGLVERAEAGMGECTPESSPHAPTANGNGSASDHSSTNGHGSGNGRRTGIGRTLRSPK